MTRARRIALRVQRMPSWGLRVLLRLPFETDYHEAARRELWLRSVEDVVESATDVDSGPWPVVAPGGRPS